MKDTSGYRRTRIRMVGRFSSKKQAKAEDSLRLNNPISKESDAAERQQQKLVAI